MLFFYVRHGDPSYETGSLLPLGHRQAEAAAKRLALFGIDKIYASTSPRAIQTAAHTCELVKKDMTLLDFCNETHAWEDFTVNDNNKKRWIFCVPEIKKLFCSPEIRALGDKWYEHPYFRDYDYKKGVERVRTESDKFFASLGYEHIPGTGAYKVTAHSDERVALFAHQGFGIAFLSCLLDIDYPTFSMHFDICNTGITVINFNNEDGYAYPKVLTLSSDSHLYREGLPVYNYGARF